MKIARYTPYYSPTKHVAECAECTDGSYVLYTDAKARHEQLLVAINDLITAVSVGKDVGCALKQAQEQAEKLKEI